MARAHRGTGGAGGVVANEGDRGDGVVVTRVLVCGPRDWPDYWTVFEVLDGEHRANPITCLIEGGALGVDRFARAWAVKNGVPTDPCPVDHAPIAPRPEPSSRSAATARTIIARNGWRAVVVGLQNDKNTV